MVGGGSLRLTGLDCPKISFFAAILVLMRHMSVDIPISCPRLLGFFSPVVDLYCSTISLEHDLIFLCGVMCCSGALLELIQCFIIFHESMQACTAPKKETYSGTASLIPLEAWQNVIWEGCMYTVWLRTRICFTWKFPPCECTNNPTRLVNLADYQLANELMMEILYKWGIMLRSNVSTFKNEAHSPEHKSVFECEGCGLKPRLSSQRVYKQGEFHYRSDTDNLTRHAERFPNPLVLFHISDWERARRKCLEREGSSKKKWEGDWANLLSNKFKGPFRFFTARF